MKKTNGPILILLFFLFLISAHGADSKPAKHRDNKSIEIGILEDWFDLNLVWPDKTKITHVEQVRLVFKYSGGKWSAFPHDVTQSDQLDEIRRFYMGDRSWVAVLQGKNIGELSTSLSPSHHWSFNEIGATFIKKYERIPDSGPRSHKFSLGLETKDSEATSMKRPLVLLSKPVDWAINDREGWQKQPNPTSPIPKDVALLLKKELTKRDLAVMNHDVIPIDDFFTSRCLTYTDFYHSRDGRTLFGIQFRKKLNIHDSVYWFIRRPNGKLMILPPKEQIKCPDDDGGIIRPSMTLLDYGDFDGDGRTEFIFWLSEDNFNGYCLFWDNFKILQSYEWNYH